MIELNVGALGGEAYPFLLVDKVLSCTPLKRVTGLKNITANDPLISTAGSCGKVFRRAFFLEAFRQLARVVATDENADEAISLELTKIESMEFTGTAAPMDQVVLDIELTSIEDKTFTAKCAAEVDGVQVAAGILFFGVSS